MGANENARLAALAGVSAQQTATPGRDASVTSKKVSWASNSSPR